MHSWSVIPKAALRFAEGDPATLRIAKSDLDNYLGPPLFRNVKPQRGVGGLLDAVTVQDLGDGQLVLQLLRVGALLRRYDPRAFEPLARVPATFVKDHAQRENPALMSYQRPHLALDGRRRLVGGFWSPPFEGPLRVAPAAERAAPATEAPSFAFGAAAPAAGPRSHAAAQSRRYSGGCGCGPPRVPRGGKGPA